VVTAIDFAGISGYDRRRCCRPAGPVAKSPAALRTGAIPRTLTYPRPDFGPAPKREGATVGERAKWRGPRNDRGAPPEGHRAAAAVAQPHPRGVVPEAPHPVVARTPLDQSREQRPSAASRSLTIGRSMDFHVDDCDIALFVEPSQVIQHPFYCSVPSDFSALPNSKAVERISRSQSLRSPASVRSTQQRELHIVKNHKWI
jgi:hypothetical protein